MTNIENKAIEEIKKKAMACDRLAEVDSYHRGKAEGLLLAIKIIERVMKESAR